ncbi:MAG: hypothetical protein GTO29_13370 [Candidatus Latescibacteria bacterium]|nr:hypothetical protein [Candidatus Latescibacterota bacterium]NIO57241.1 hypothetical protein [Candidatus Latescibacterota bacterium]
MLSHKLDLTEEQQPAVAEALAKARDAVHELRDQCREGEIDRETLRKNVSSFREQVLSELEAILSEEQLKTLEEMKEARINGFVERR